jgi:hypothetical protein
MEPGAASEVPQWSQTTWPTGGPRYRTRWWPVPRPSPARQRVQLLNPPGSEVGPGQVATWGRATADRVEGFGFKWEWDGKSSKHIPFEWSGP